MSANPVRCSFVFISKQNEVLLLQEGGILANGLWSLPGGHVDEHESSEDGAVREALEESGYQVSLEGILLQRVISALEYKGHPKDTGDIEITIFKGKIIGGEMKKDPEALDLQWFEIHEALQLPHRWPFLKDLILKK